MSKRRSTFALAAIAAIAIVALAAGVSWALQKDYRPVAVLC